MTEDAKNPAADENSRADKKGRAEDQPKNSQESVKTATDDIAEAEIVEETDSDKKSEEESDSSSDSNEDTKDDSKSEDSETAKDNASDESQDNNSAENAKNNDTVKAAEEDSKHEAKKQASKRAKDSTGNQETSESYNRQNSAEFQEQVREQIENCKFEIISSIQESVHAELVDSTQKQIRKVERRRRFGYIMRDILILILAATIGYLGYCLYDVKYFDFMKSECERNNTCPINEPKGPEMVEPEVVKDIAWYRQNYGYLFDSLQIGLNADKVEAYYLYSGDYKVNDIQANFLLSMAYNRLNSSVSYDSAGGIIVPAADLRTAYIDLVGNADNFAKRNFTYHCAEFEYDKNSDTFGAASVLCADQANRTIIEAVDEIYEEGNALYFLTTATIFDRNEQSFYTFDNLFKPAVANVSEADLAKHSSLLNHYQYQFKKTGDKYYFSGIIKLN